jgi:hypothetical protein
MAAEKLVKKVLFCFIFILSSSKQAGFGVFCGQTTYLMPLGTHFGLALHARNYGHEVPHSHQIVGGTGEGKEPINLADSAMPQFTQQRNRLQPPETFLDALSLALTDGVARMPRSAFINRAPATSFMILRHVGHHPLSPGPAIPGRR